MKEKKIEKKITVLIQKWGQLGASIIDKGPWRSAWTEYLVHKNVFNLFCLGTRWQLLITVFYGNQCCHKVRMAPMKIVGEIAPWNFQLHMVLC